MKKLILGTITAGKIINDLQESAELYTDENIPFPLWLSNLNEAISLIHAASGDRDKERYRSRVVIPVEKRVSSVQVEDSNYDDTSFVLTVPYDGPVWTNDEDGFDESWLGALGTLLDTSDSDEYPIKIIEVIDGQNVVVESTNGRTIPAIIDDNLIVDIKTTVSKAADEIDLTLYDNYKRIDYIEKLTFTKGGGGKTSGVLTEHMAVGPPKVTIKNFDGMRYSQNYKKIVIWYLQGEILKCSKGELTSYGNRLLYVVLKPKPVTEETDLLDVVDELLPQVKKVTMIMSVPADKMKLAFPNEWLTYFNQLQASKAAVKEEKEKNK